MSHDLGAATLALGQSVGAYQFFLPRLSEVRRANVIDDPDVAADVRMGEVAAAALTLGIGGIMSSLTKSTLPIIITVLVSIILIGVYEWTLRTHRPMERVS